MYGVYTGTVQAYLSRMEPFVCRHFGRVEYDRRKPIISTSNIRKIDIIVSQLNDGDITEDEAFKRLDIL